MSNGSWNGVTWLPGTTPTAYNWGEVRDASGRRTNTMPAGSTVWVPPGGWVQPLTPGTGPVTPPYRGGGTFGPPSPPGYRPAGGASMGMPPTPPVMFQPQMQSIVPMAGRAIGSAIAVRIAQIAADIKRQRENESARQQILADTRTAGAPTSREWMERGRDVMRGSSTPREKRVMEDIDAEIARREQVRRQEIAAGVAWRVAHGIRAGVPQEARRQADIDAQVEILRRDRARFEIEDRVSMLIRNQPDRTASIRSRALRKPVIYSGDGIDHRTGQPPKTPLIHDVRASGPNRYLDIVRGVTEAIKILPDISHSSIPSAKPGAMLPYTEKKSTTF